MENLFKLFNQHFFGEAKIIVIGGEARKILALRNNWQFPDLTKSSHLDILIEISSIKEINLVRDILAYFKAKPMSDLCYEAYFDNIRLEFVGLVIGNRLFTIKIKESAPRPDLTIERFGYYNDLSHYDESGRGWSDFNSRKIVLMNSNLFLRKYLKIMSLKFQTRFSFDDSTEKIIKSYEEKIRVPKNKQNLIFDYNIRLFKTYGVYSKDDLFQVGIHVALLYLRAHDYNEVTSYIDNHARLRAYLIQAGVDYNSFELQAKNGCF